MFSTLTRSLLVAVITTASPGALFAASITVSPVSESIAVTATRQITATVTGLTNAAVTWSVNGMPGGNPTVGTISPTGLYTAPATVPNPASVTITATSQMDPSVFGTGTLNVKSLGPVLSQVTPTAVTTGPFSLTITGSGFQPGAIVVLSNMVLTVNTLTPTVLTASGNTNQTGALLLRVMNPGSTMSNSLTVTFSPGPAASGGPLSISPANPTIIQGYSQLFSALQYNVPTTATWSVNGIPGGNATVGTISSSGLYTAPASIPTTNPVTITASAPNATPASTLATIGSSAPPTLTQATPGPIPLGAFSLSLTGSGFLPNAIVSLGGTPLLTTYISSTQLTAAGAATLSGPSTLTVSNGPISATPFPVHIGVLNPQVPAPAARRFLEQAAFGPTASEAANVQTLGFAGWLNQQFALPKVSNFTMTSNQVNYGPRFLTNTVNNPDQLRQRVGFALSQIFVVSVNKTIWTNIQSPFEDMLLTDAFSNFRQLLEDVTLHGAMGYYLDMANNSKANANSSVLPNENYAREVLQLFSIGTWMLNPDGTRQLDSQGNPIPTYDQATIAEFARVFTGWTNYSTPPTWNTYLNTNGPLVPVPAFHDMGPKSLLLGKTLPGNQLPQKDLADALDNIFNHPNTGPFIGKQLIQHLVKSNPSPAYVARVTAAFSDNGQGVRGDLKAVITAILLDPEARSNDLGGNDQPTDGHLQEPVLFLSGLLRAFNANVNEQNYYGTDLIQMQQDIFNAPSVFNYYSPNYRIPGTSLTGGAFQIYSASTSVYRSNLANGLFNAYQNNIQTNGPGSSMDLTPYVAIASSPAQLVDALDVALTHGTMPSPLKQILVTAVTNETGGNLRRVQTGIWLILTSGYYNVWH